MRVESSRVTAATPPSETVEKRRFVQDAVSMPSPTIALARREDVAPSLAFANWAAENTSANFALEPESLESWQTEFDLRHEMYPWLVARFGESVVGFAKASPHRARGAYQFTADVTVYIDPAHHRRGLASALYRVLLPLLRTQGYVTLLAGITTPHEASERLHAVSGFRRCGAFRRAGWKFGKWHDVSYWELHLQPEGATPTAVRSVSDAWSSVKPPVTLLRP
jgi:L-amino acid N-acyltransferase YncA